MGSAITPELVRRLSSARWLIPLLAAMSGEGGSRFGALAERLSISRSMLAQSIDRLEQFGWVCRNPGHGHPLRPEYLLTAEGRPIAAWCAAVMKQRTQLGIEPPALGRWSLPLLLELRPGWRRFSSLQQSLTPVSPRALSLSLKQMIDARLIERRLEAEFPPLPLYGLSGRGKDLAQPLAAVR